MHDKDHLQRRLKHYILLQSAIRRIFSPSIFGFFYRVSRHGYFVTRGTCVNVRRREEAESWDGDNIRRHRRHWSQGGIIMAPALQGNNHQNVSPCLLSPPSCNMQTADSLQTSCRLFDFRKIKERASQWISENYIFPLLSISLLHYWSREGTCHVSRDNVSHVMSWAGAGHWSAFVRCLHYTLSLFVRNIEHSPHATSNSLKLNMFRQKGEYYLDPNETEPQWSNERAQSLDTECERGSVLVGGGTECQLCPRYKITTIISKIHLVNVTYT